MKRMSWESKMVKMAGYTFTWYGPFGIDSQSNSISPV